ncbi:MAG: DUF1501 domain-containing protein, partial [Rubrivivax sp.]
MRASSMWSRPCQTRYFSLTRMWHICTGRKYSSVGCHTPRSNTSAPILKAWLDLPPTQRPRLVTLYLEQYDVASHAAGMHSAQAMQALATVDAGLARLRDGLRARGLGDSVDLIVLSDHGMSD